MAEIIIDAMDDAGPWAALAPDDATPSAEITHAADSATFYDRDDGRSLRVEIASGGLDHRLRRSFSPALDLRAFDELRLAIRADRLADGAPGRPFFLELRLASAAVPLADPANPWHRLVPVLQRGIWEVPRFGLDDLPAGVRGAVAVMQLRCADAARPLTCNLDGLRAVRDEMMRDAEAALLARLDQGLSLGGAPVAAEIQVAGAPPPATLPLILIIPYDVRYDEARGSATRGRSDFRTDGYRIRPASHAYDLYYAIEARAGTRADQAAILEFALEALPPHDHLAVNGFRLPMDLVRPPAEPEQSFPIERQLLHLRLSAQREIGRPQLVRPAETVVTTIDYRMP